MNHILLDAFRHNAWATARLLEMMRALPDEQLSATVPGAYGNMLATLHHCVQSEGFYCYVLADGQPGFTWDLSAQPAFDELERRVGDLGRFWDGWLVRPIDPDHLVARHNPDGTRDEAPVGVVLAQVLNHGSVHREQVSAILTSAGLTPPAIDAWAYGIAAGRVTMAVREAST